MNQYDWHLWFAWYPVKINSYGKGWLRLVERRHIGAVAPNGDLTDYWEYRIPRAPLSPQPRAGEVTPAAKNGTRSARSGRPAS